MNKAVQHIELNEQNKPTIHGGPMLIEVTNKNDFVIKDMHNSVNYVFEPGKATKIPYDAAIHIFGIAPESGEDEVFSYVCKRRGWNTGKHQDEGLDRKYFGKLYFVPIQLKVIEVPVKERAESA